MYYGGVRRKRTPLVYIYKITNLVNGMCYIGATVQPLERRLQDHFSRAKSSDRTSILHKAIREFGKENFTAEVLRYARNSEELTFLEIQAIKEHGTLAPDGYNMTTGGKGTMDRRQLESTKLLIAQKATGRICSEETKEKLSAALKGKEQPWNKGRKLGPAWNKGIPHTEAAKANMVASHIGKLRPDSRAIEMYGVTYKSIKDAAETTGFSRQQVKYRLATGRAKYLSEPKRTGRLPGNSKAVQFNGKIYDSLLEAARENKTSTTLIRYHIRTGTARYVNPPEQGTKDKLDE